MPIFPLIPELTENVRKSPLHLGDVDLGDIGKERAGEESSGAGEWCRLGRGKKTVIWRGGHFKRI